MTESNNKDNFTDVIQIIQTPPPAPIIPVPPVTQVVVRQGTVVTLGGNTNISTK